MSNGPVLKQRLKKMAVGVKGGRHYSEFHYMILANGQETNITRLKRTNDSPDYALTDDLFRCDHDGEEFDNFAAEGAGMRDWVVAHLGHPKGP